MLSIFVNRYGGSQSDKQWSWISDPGTDGVDNIRIPDIIIINNNTHGGLSDTEKNTV